MVRTFTVFSPHWSAMGWFIHVLLFWTFTQSGIDSRHCHHEQHGLLFVFFWLVVFHSFLSDVLFSEISQHSVVSTSPNEQTENAARAMRIHGVAVCESTELEVHGTNNCNVRHHTDCRCQRFFLHHHPVCASVLNPVLFFIFVCCESSNVTDYGKHFLCYCSVCAFLSRFFSLLRRLILCFSFVLVSVADPLSIVMIGLLEMAFPDK